MRLADVAGPPSLPRPWRRWRDVAIAAIPALLLAAAWFGLQAAGYFVQSTASLSKGVWRHTPYTADSRYVTLCPPEQVARYVPRSAATNDCDGRTPLLKAIVARSGDVVTLSASALHVNDQAIPATAAWQGPNGPRAYPPGRYVVAPGEIWVIANHHERSLDSRYFGPLREDALRGGARPVWTW